jgi:hypothetical protein
MPLSKNSERNDSGARCTSRPFDHAEVGDLAFVQLKLQHGADFVEARAPDGTGVQVQSAPRGDALNQQDVAVTADEEVWAVHAKLGQDSACIAGGTPTDVGHPNPGASHFKRLVLGPSQANVLAIVVAEDRAAWRDPLQRFGHLQRADVTCVPDFIRALHMSQNLVVDVAVSVRQE